MADGSVAACAAVSQGTKKKIAYKPLFARVLIEREIQTQQGGVLIPETIAKRHARCEGIVIAVGPTADESVKIGSHVVFGRHAGTWLDATYAPVRGSDGKPFGIADKDDGTLFLCLDEDILCVIEDQKTVN